MAHESPGDGDITSAVSHQPLSPAVRPAPHSAGDTPHGRKLASLCQTQTCCRLCKVNYSAAIALRGRRARARRESEAKHVLRRRKTRRWSSRRGSLGLSASTGNPFPAGTLFRRRQRGETADFGFSFFFRARFADSLAAVPLPLELPKTEISHSKKLPMETPKLWKNLKHGEKVVTLSRGGFSDVSIKRLITRASWKHFFSHLHTTGRDVETQLLSN